MDNNKNKVYILDINRVIIEIVDEVSYQYEIFNFIKEFIKTELFKVFDLVVYGELLVVRDVRTLQCNNEGISIIRSVFSKLEIIISNHLFNLSDYKYYNEFNQLLNREPNFLHHICTNTIAYRRILEQIYFIIGDDCLFDVWDIVKNRGIFYLRYEGTFQELEYYRITGQQPWK